MKIINCPYCGTKIEETDKVAVELKYCQKCKKYFAVNVYLEVDYYEKKEEE
jgi:Zn-finger nucleic acid-binding protein